MWPLLNSGRADVDRSEILSVFFASDSTSKVSQFQVSKRTNTRRDPAVDEDQIRDTLDKVKPYQLIGPEEMHPRMLRDQADVIAALL